MATRNAGSAEASVMEFSAVKNAIEAMMTMTGSAEGAYKLAAGQVEAMKIVTVDGEEIVTLDPENWVSIRKYFATIPAVKEELAKESAAKLAEGLSNEERVALVDRIAEIEAALEEAEAAVEEWDEKLIGVEPSSLFGNYMPTMTAEPEGGFTLRKGASAKSKSGGRGRSTFKWDENVSYEKERAGVAWLARHDDGEWKVFADGRFVAAGRTVNEAMRSQEVADIRGVEWHDSAVNFYDQR